MIENENLRIHSRIEESYANGPGKRAVIWTQGCSLSCPECCNPFLQDPAGGRLMKIGTLLEWLVSLKNIEGLTVSGGEPTEQMTALISLLEMVKQQTDLSVLIFSGRTYSQINSISGGAELLNNVDVLIDGPYDHTRANPAGSCPPSSNQNILFLTDRYTFLDFDDLPGREIFIKPDGAVISTGLQGIKSMSRF